MSDCVCCECGTEACIAIADILPGGLNWYGLPMHRLGPQRYYCNGCYLDIGNQRQARTFEQAAVQEGLDWQAQQRADG